MSSYLKTQAVSPEVEIWTEGKTDWRFLKKAREKLGLEPNIIFHESEEDMGDKTLLQNCRAFSQKHNESPLIFIFDRDNEKILREVQDPDKDFKHWGNNVYSFAIPVPKHRFDSQQICIELYLSDEEIKTQDKDGRRLFLSSEFNEKSGKHRLDATINVGHKGVLKGCIEHHKVKILDAEVYDASNNNITLSKSAFANNILNDIEPFDSFNFEEFRNVFIVIEQIMRTSTSGVSVYFLDQKTFLESIQDLPLPSQFAFIFQAFINLLEMILYIFIATTIRCYEEKIINEPEQYKKKAKSLQAILKSEFRQPSLKTLYQLGRSCYYLVDSNAPQRLIQMKESLETIMVLGDIGHLINNLERFFPPKQGISVIRNKPEIKRGIIDYILPELIKYSSKPEGLLRQRVEEVLNKEKLDITKWQNAVIILLSKAKPILSNTFVSKTLESVDTQAHTYNIGIRTYKDQKVKYEVSPIPAENVEQYQTNISEMLISDDISVQLFPFLLIKDDSLFFYKRTLASGYEYYSIKKNKAYIQGTKKKFNHSVFRSGSRQELFWTEVLPVVNKSNNVKANIPTEGFDNFVGRNKQINKIMEEIIEIPNQNGIVYGLGGIGKTALMMAVSKKLSSTPDAESVVYDNIIWVSAKSDYYDYIFNTIEYKDPQFRSLDNVLFAVLEFFDFEDLDEYDFDDRKELVLQVLEQNRVLLILDNFETVHSNEAEKIVKFFDIEVKRTLRTMPERFKVIITSRKQIPSGFHQIELKGLDLRESKKLMNALYKRYATSKPELSNDQKTRFYDFTKGIPIVLKHYLAKIYEYNEPVETVMRNLPSYSSGIVQFSFNEILQEIEKKDKEKVGLQILLLLELANRPFMIRQIADILEMAESTIEQGIPKLRDYQCIRGINQDNQEKFVVNEDIRLLTRSLAQEHGELVQDIRQRIKRNFSIDKQMDYEVKEQGIVEIFENYLTQRDYLEAENFITLQLKKNPESVLINYHYARYLKTQKRDIPKAIEILEQIRESSVNHPSILRLLFSCYISLDVPNFDKANVYVDRLERELGHDEDMKLEIAEFYIRWSTSVRLGTRLDPLEEMLRQSKYKTLASKAIAILNKTHTRTWQIYYLFSQGYFNMWENASALGMINKAIAEASRGDVDYPQPLVEFKRIITRNLEIHRKRKRGRKRIE